MRKVSVLMLFVLILAMFPIQSAVGKAPPSPPVGAVEVSPAVQQDLSAPLSTMLEGPTPANATGKKTHEKALKLFSNAGGSASDPVIQAAAVAPLVAVTAGLNFAGVGNGDYGFAPNAAPPDTNGIVGATQYVQWVNSKFAVFNKTTGALVYGPVNGNTLWTGFGGGCEANNDGDPIVQYDKAAGRWVMSQFSVTTLPYLQCVAVSTTSDATGTYNRYAFSYTDFPDYPKMGVWPDGYYTTFNMFAGGTTFSGARACAYDRAKMLTGAAATQQCFQLSTAYGGLLPSDLDGSIAPPSGSPNFIMNFGTNSLNLWKFHVDWMTSGLTTLSAPTNIPVASFSRACNGGACIAQSGTSTKLDSLGDRLMYRLAYRRFADGHEAIVATHSVTAGTKTGVRWYEVRSPNATPVIYQQSTYAPDTANYRWMSSGAMDKNGDLAIGYSASSSTTFPSIRYTGRLATDALNTLQSETIMKSGGGSQNAKLNRWGDYSTMSIDPVDDCTFWFTSEYLKATGSFNWSTQIASFKFPSCN